MTKSLNVVAITGASSGIGAALARHYAAPGRTLALIGRHAERLESVAQDCRAKGASTEIGIVDVRDRYAIAGWLLSFDARATIDLLIANAGILTGSLEHRTIESLDMSTLQIETNFLGALNTALPLLERMLARGHGQIAFTSSLAAFATHPDWPAYCASKAGLLVYAISLRERVRGRGVRINAICPGWVTAPINDPFEMWRPMEMKPEAAAKVIARGLARDKAVIAFPQPLAWSSRRLVPLLPQIFQRLGYKAFKARHRTAPR